jgi:hypothetical protein
VKQSLSSSKKLAFPSDFFFERGSTVVLLDEVSKRRAAHVLITGVTTAEPLKTKKLSVHDFGSGNENLMMKMVVNIG